jgi:hypothetical protein
MRGDYEKRSLSNGLDEHFYNPLSFYPYPEMITSVLLSLVLFKSNVSDIQPQCHRGSGRIEICDRAFDPDPNDPPTITGGSGTR